MDQSEFETNGFVIFKSVVSSDARQHIQNQIEAILDKALESISEYRPDSKKTLDEKYLYLKKQSPALKAHAYDLIRYADALKSSSVNPSVLEFIKLILGPTLLLDGVQVRIDDPSDDRLLPFHQEVFGQISERCLTLWCPLTDVNMENGPLRVVPGSHRLGKLPHQFRSDFRNYHGVVKDIPEKSVKYITLQAGDGLIFHPLLLHASGANRSSEVRWTFITRYNSISNVPYLQSSDAPSHIEQK